MVYDAKEEMLKQELLWFFNQAESALGIRSSWNAMVHRSLLGDSSSSGDPEEAMLATIQAASRIRRIEHAFFNLSELHQRYFYAAFGPNKLPILLDRLFRQNAPAVLALAKNPAEVMQLAHRFSIGTATDKDKQLISRLRIEAMQLSAEAMKQIKKRYK